MTRITKLMAHVLALATAGCASMTSNPWLKEALTQPEVHKISSDAEKVRLSFIASAMMEKDDRLKLFAEVSNRTSKGGWDAFDTGTFAQMTTDAVIGDLGSQAGSDVGMAVFVGAAVFGEIFDGSMSRASQIWLPATFQGRPIRTVEDANAAANQLVFQKITDMARRLGWTAECLTRCPSDNQIIHLTRPADQRNPGYTYWPTEFIAHTNRLPMEAIPADLPIRYALGTDVAWQSPHGNSAFINFYSKPKRDSEGHVTILKSENSDFQYPHVAEDLAKTHIGRDLQRLVHADGLSFFGTTDPAPSLFAYGGDIYGFWSNSNTRMITMQLDEPNLLTTLIR